MAPENALWGSGEAYEGYVGRWSRLVAADFVRWLGVEPGRRWLDIGCGTGALTQVVVSNCRPASVQGIDPSEKHIAHAREHVLDSLASFETGDAQQLPVPDSSFDVAVSGLVLNFVPDPARAAAEFSRVLRRGGIAAAYVWDYAGEMQMMRHFWDAAIELDAGAIQLDEGRRSPLCKPEPLSRLFASAGFADVETTAITIPTRFKDFDDFWLPFLNGNAPDPAYAMSLSEKHRAELRERIQSRLPTADDGSISLFARAWAVRGRKSSNL